ncbi:MAG: prepilin-type N-terminal cleavage/methylation domain-containing protein, partial [Chthoniobacterales bacterium]
MSSSRHFDFGRGGFTLLEVLVASVMKGRGRFSCRP